MHKLTASLLKAPKVDDVSVEAKEAAASHRGLLFLVGPRAEPFEVSGLKVGDRVLGISD